MMLLCIRTHTFTPINIESLRVRCLGIAFVANNRHGRKYPKARPATIHIHALQSYTEYSQERNLKNIPKNVT